MLKIWGRRNSSNVKKVLWCAEELELPYTQIDAGGSFGKVDDAAYRALNPNGLVPTIEDGDFVLWESNTILRYLAAKHKAEALYPADIRQRAIIEQWMDWTSTSFTSPFGVLMKNLIRTPEPQRDMAATEAGAKRCAELLTIVDGVLANQPYLAGDGFTLADIVLAPFAYVWLNMPMDRPGLPHLQAWYERMGERPAFRKIVMIPIS